jgi:hypothetical protein
LLRRLAGIAHPARETRRGRDSGLVEQDERVSLIRWAHEKMGFEGPAGFSFFECQR